MLVEALPSDFLTHSETHSSPTWIHHVTDSDSFFAVSEERFLKEIKEEEKITAKK